MASITHDPPSARPSTLSARISDVLAASYSDADMRSALSVLDARGFNNSADARRRLRLDVQEEVIRANGTVLDEFAGVADELRRVEESLKRLEGTCAALRRHIGAAGRTTRPVLQEADELVEQRRGVETKARVLDAVRTHFLLSEDEERALTAQAQPVDEAFFAALKKCQRVHADSRVLLASADDRLGLAILETSSKTLDAAFQKLFHWTQREFRTLDLENPQLSAAMRRALRVLAERSALFDSSLDAFAAAREEILSSSFHAALTGAGDAVVGKPIEFQAHDPLRYISDMLAWVHSATVSEREALEVLFIGEGEELARGIQTGRANDPLQRSHDDDDDDNNAISQPPAPALFDGRKALNELVGRDIVGVTRQLRTRCEHVIRSQEDSVLAYQIANLLAFYAATFRRLLDAADDDAAVLPALDALHASALRQFRATAADAVALMQPDLARVPASTATPEFLRDALDVLAALARSFDGSLAASSTASDPEALFAPVLSAALDPFLKGAEAQWTRLAQPRGGMMAANCLLAARGVLAGHAFARGRVERLDGAMAEYTNVLVAHVHAYLLSASRLGPLVAAVLPIAPTDAATLRKVALISDRAALRSVAEALDGFLPGGMEDAMEEVRGLESRRVAREVAEEAAELFCADFEGVEERLLSVDEAAADGDEDGGSEESGDDEGRFRIRDVFPRTSEEVRTLLS